MTIRKIRILFFAALAMVFVGTVDAKQFFRFKNKEGQTMIIDQLTPEAIEVGYDIINQDGRLVQSIPPAKTLGELQDEEKRRKAEKRKKIEQRKQLRRDAELLKLFSTVEDIMRARDAALLGIDQRRELNKNERNLLIAGLEDYQRQAADYERLGKPVPKRLQDSIDAQQEQIAKREETSEIIDEEEKELKAEFENDMIRFKELQAKRAAFRFRNDDKKQKNNMMMMTCAEDECDSIWQLAQIYAKDNASGRLEVVTDTIILTSAPTKDDEIGISFSRLPSKSDTQIIMEVSCNNTDEGLERCKSRSTRSVVEGFEEFVGNQLR